jgi:ferredoxin-nitrite reductase
LVFISTSPNSLESLACPGLFYPTVAQDGILARIRTPGGLLSNQQVRVIVDLAASIGLESIQVTNRANLQLKLSQTLTPDIFQQLQAVKLAAPIPAVDHLRNIMASPTAGIDPQAVLDTRPIVGAIDRYIASHPELVGLSAKCSIGIDGGEAVSIRQRPNDLILVAHRQGLRLFLNMGDGIELDTGLGCGFDDAVPLIAAIYHIYLEHAPALPSTPQQHRRSKKPRLRQLVAHWGLDWFRSLLAAGFDDQQELNPATTSKPGGHLGIHRQRQTGYAYVGLVLPLGQLSIDQLQGLGDLADQYGDSSLRLTPWQNIILPNVLETELPQVIQKLAQLGLPTNAHHPAGSIAACRGKPGCQAAETNSHVHAQELIQQLTARLDQPLQIHVSGCGKGCAHPLGSDIALLGISDEQTEGYEIYLRSGNQTFGHRLFPVMPVEQAMEVIDRLLRIYQQQRRTAQESFDDFVQGHPFADLHQLFALPIDSQT